VLKVTRLFIGDGFKEPLQGITKPHVRLGLVRFHICRDRQVPGHCFERPLRRHVLHLIVPPAFGNGQSTRSFQLTYKHLLNSLLKPKDAKARFVLAKTESLEW
jgi:hypothetical protein